MNPVLFQWNKPVRGADFEKSVKPCQSAKSLVNVTCPQETGPLTRRVCSCKVRSNAENRRCGNHVSPKSRSWGFCRSMVGISRSSLACRARPERHARLKERLITLSGKYRMYGYRMLHAMLVREGFKVNVKVVERIPREERLWLRRTKRKKIPKEGREG